MPMRDCCAISYFGNYADVTRGAVFCPPAVAAGLAAWAVRAHPTSATPSDRAHSPVAPDRAPTVHRDFWWLTSAGSEHRMDLQSVL